MRRTAIGLLFLMISMSTALAAPSATEWPNRARIETSGNEGHVNLVIQPDSPLWATGGPELTDLRIFDQAGSEVASVLWRPEPLLTGSVTPMRLFNVGRDEMQKSATATADFGEGPLPYLSALTLDLLAPERYLRPVSVQVSPDLTNWTEIKTTEMLFDLRSQGGPQSNILHLVPPVKARYVKVHVYDAGDQPLTIQGIRGVTVPRLLESPFALAYSGPLSLTRNAETKESLFSADFGSTRRISRVQIRPETAQNYHRNVQVEGSDDGKKWLSLGGGVIYAFDVQGRHGEGTWLDLAECTCRYLRLTIYDGDDQPLDLQRLTAEGLSYRLLFEARSSNSYWVYAGNPATKPPSYDLARLPLERGALPLVVHGDLELNPAFQPPPDTRPWTERHPWLMPSAVALAVLVVGAATLKMVRAIVKG